MEPIQTDGEKTSVKITVLASDVLSRVGLGRFAIDFGATTAKHERLALDYCHNEEEIVGFAESFEFTDAGIFAVGTILKRPGVECRANEIAENVGRGVPYEASPLLDFTNATVETVASGSDAVVNGRRVSGPLDIYRGAVIRGLAICPQGQDGETAVVAFSVQKKESAEMKDEEKTAPTDATKDAPEDGGGKKAINAELEAMIDEFGKERGVDYYLSGMSLDDAKADDYDQLKKARDAAPEPEPPANATTDGAKDGATDGAKKKEEDATTAALSALAVGLDELKKELVALKSSLKRGAVDPIADDKSAPSPESDLAPLARMALKFERSGVVRNVPKKQ